MIPRNQWVIIGPQLLLAHRSRTALQRLDPIWLRKSDLVGPERVGDLPPILPKDQRHKPRIASRALCKRS
jgi:hypothetical protein